MTSPPRGTGANVIRFIPRARTPLELWFAYWRAQQITWLRYLESFVPR